MKTDPAEDQARHDATLEYEGSAEDEEQEAESLHDVSDSDDLTIAETQAATSQRFYARLRHELAIRGIDYDKLPKLTPEGDSPRCFTAVGAPFDEWLASASLVGATIPYRYDMPAEPNYCWDCTRRFRARATAAGVCNFPKTKFEPLQIVISEEDGKQTEVSIVGVSRSMEETVAEAQLVSLLPEE